MTYKLYKVTRLIELSKVIEATSKQAAIEQFSDLDADQKFIKETAVIWGVLPGIDKN